MFGVQRPLVWFRGMIRYHRSMQRDFSSVTEEEDDYISCENYLCATFVYLLVKMV